MSETLTLIAPLAGWAMPLGETPDPVFAEKMLGDGLAIDPTVGELRAPCDGEVIGLHACSHALTIRAANGAEILLHVGLETVRCAGAGFESLTAVGRQVVSGELLLRFDLDFLARLAASLVSPVVVISARGFGVEPLVAGREVAFGEPVLTLRPRRCRAECRSPPRPRRCGGGSGSGSRMVCMPGRRRWSRRRPGPSPPRSRWRSAGGAPTPGARSR